MRFGFKLSPVVSASRGRVVAYLFGKGEPGAHFEAYNPDTLLKRRNLLTWSEDFTNAAWTKVNVSVAGNKIESTSAAGSELRQDAVVSNGAVTITFFVRKGNTATDANRFGLRNQTTATNLIVATVNYDTGAIAYQVGASGAKATSLGDGAWRIELTVENLTPGTLVRASMFSGYSVAAGAYAYLDAMQMEGAKAFTNYQRVTDWTTEYLAAAGDRIGMWQDSAGTVPVMKVEDPVGFWRDTKAGTTKGVEKWNDAAISISGSSSRISTNVYRIYSPDGTYSGVFNGGGTAGKWYEVTFTIDSITTLGGGIQMEGAAAPATFTSVGPKRAIYQASTGTMGLKRASTACDMQVSNVSFKELPGNHATQGTTASRPTLSARYNLCTNNNYSPSGLTGVAKAGDAAAVLSVVDDASALAAAGLSSVCSGNVYKLDNSAGTGLAWAEVSNSGLSVGGQYVAAAYLRSSGNATLAIQGNGASYGSYATYTRVTKTASVAASTDKLQVYAQAGTVVYFILNDLRTADDAAKNIPAYQRVNTATDYDTEGFPHYLYFNGIDRSLQTGNMDLTGVDKVTVWAGLTKLSDAANGCVCEFSADTNTSPGFAMFAPIVTTASLHFRSRGSLTPSGQAHAGISTYLPPVSAVACGAADIAGDSVTLRVNGTQAAADFATDQGSGTYGVQALYIGRRGGSTLPFNGRLYSLTVRATPSFVTGNSLVAQMERYAANLMKKALA